MTTHSFGRAIVARLDELAAITDIDGEITRLYLSPSHRRAADRVARWMRDAGMSVEITGLGDVIGRYEGVTPDAAALVIGSHIDSVRNAGRYDGNLGVLAGIAIVQRLHDEGRRMPFAIDVVAFGDEEGVRFPSALTGSQAFSGRFNPAVLNETDQDGITRREALKIFGAPPASASSLKRIRQDTLGYVEIHIEQGPVLEAKDLPLGIVTAINGCSRGSVAVTGWAGHAGTVPMALRKDALAAAAEMVLAIEACARAHPDLVATVGQLRLPGGGAVNVVPGRVEFSLDIRASDDARRHRAVETVRASCHEIAAQRGVGVKVDMTYDAPAAQCDAGFSDALAHAVARVGAEPLRLPSGAGHDAMSFRDALPFTMLFVRCKGGVSHNPAEYTTPEDIDIATRALAEFVEGLST